MFRWKSTRSRRVLADVVKAFPVPLESIQVDGGSEFMRHSWRSELQGRLPEARHRTPRPAAATPQWNGCVERANRTARIGFWNFLDCELTVKAVSTKLLEYEFFYNYQRPHSALDYLTQRAPCRSGGCLAPVPDVVNRYTSD